MDKKLLTILLVAVVAVLVASATFSPLTIISVSKVEIQPEGYVDEDNNVKGTYWITTMTTDFTDKAVAWKFNNASDRDKYYQGERVDVASEIEIVIDPEPPYWIRPLEVHSHQVYPETWGTWRDWFLVTKYGKTDTSVPSLSVNTYQFGGRADVPNEWAVHTPFWVTLKKNGVEVAKQYVDTVGLVETIKLQNPFDPTEYITIKNLGKLGTGYGQPSITDIICIEKQLNYIFTGSDEVENKINYDASDLAYSNYWWGGGKHYVCEDHASATSDTTQVERWDDTYKSPSHSYSNHQMLVKEYEFPGTYEANTFYAYVLEPVSADVWNDNPSTNPYGKSLVNYLKQYHNTLNVNVWNQGAEITEDNYLKINLPFASMSNLITVQISSEIADTVVWRPQIANVKFVSAEWQTGGTDADIQDRLQAVLTVKQFSTVKSSATIKPVLTNPSQPVTINPLATTFNLNPEETATIKFEFLNLGTDTELTNTVTFIIENTLGDETDRASLTFTLKKKGVAETILTVYTIDAETEIGIGGIPVSISFDSSSKTAYTMDGTVVFDLEGVEGPVSITTSETPIYQASSRSTTVKAGEPNVVTIRLYKKGQTPPTDVPWWLLVVVACVAVIAVWYYKYRRQ